MIQLQYILDFQGNDKNRMERELARQIEALHLSVLEEIKRQMPGEVEITRIG